MSHDPNSPYAWSRPEPQAEPAGGPPITAPELAAQLAARLCHDVISPASAIVSGLDLLEDPSASDMKDDAMNLISGSARKLVALVAFARVAFGASASAESFDARELERLMRGVYEHVRPELEWRVAQDSFNKPAARTIMNMGQLAASALPTGGVATVHATEQLGRMVIGVDAVGPRARLRAEVASGLRGDPLGEGLGGHWVQAYYLYALLKAAGGEIEFAQSDERVTFRASVPLGA